MKPQDIFWTTGAAVLQEDSALAIVTSLRPHRAPPFGREEVALQQMLVPHFQRALQLQRRVRELDMVRDTTAAALDRLPMGVILLDERGRPFVINARAQEILDQRDGLAVSTQGLEAALPSETAALGRAVEAARETAAGRGLGSGGALRLTRPSAKRPLTVLVGPLPWGRMDVPSRLLALPPSLPILSVRRRLPARHWRGFTA